MSGVSVSNVSEIAVSRMSFSDSMRLSIVTLNRDSFIADHVQRQAAPWNLAVFQIAKSSLKIGGAYFATRLHLMHNVARSQAIAFCINVLI